MHSIAINSLAHGWGMFSMPLSKSTEQPTALTLKTRRAARDQAFRCDKEGYVEAEAGVSASLLPRVAGGNKHDDCAAQHVPPEPLALHGPRVDFLRRHAGQQVGRRREQARLQHAAAFFHRHAPGQAPQQLVADVVALQAGGAKALPSLLVVLRAAYQSDSAKQHTRRVNDGGTAVHGKKQLAWLPRTVGRSGSARA